VGGRFCCVICDGQVLSVFQEHVVAMFRPGINALRVVFSLVFACAICSTKVRQVEQKSVVANAKDDTALTSAEAAVWRVFSATRLGRLPTGCRDIIAARTRALKAAALKRAFSVLFCNFWEVVHHSKRNAMPAVVPAVVPKVAAVAPGAALGSLWRRYVPMRSRPPTTEAVPKTTRTIKKIRKSPWWTEWRPAARPTRVRQPWAAVTGRSWERCTSCRSGAPARVPTTTCMLTAMLLRTLVGLQMLVRLPTPTRRQMPTCVPITTRGLVRTLLSTLSGRLKPTRLSTSELPLRSTRLPAAARSL